MTRTQSFVRASLLCTVAFAAAAMLSACTRNDEAGRVSLGSVSSQESVLVAQAAPEAEMPEVVIRASRETGGPKRL